MTRTRGSDGDRGARVAVTGGAGFIGSHLVDRLVDEGCQVLVVDDLSSGARDNLNRAAAFERVDIAVDDVEGIFRRWRPERVFHLAAQPSVPRSAQDPLRDLAVNVVGTHRVAAAAAAAGAKRLVFVSSGGAVYGETRQAATEGRTPAPASYYGVHKLAGEGHVRLAGVPWAIARPSNVYGPRQSAGLEGGVVAAFVDEARAGRPMRIDGDGTQTRDFVHVADVVAALCLLGDPAAPSGTWNVASGRRVSIGRLAQLVEAAVGRRVGRTASDRRAGDVTHSAVSAARLRSLGWRPQVALAEGIRSLLAD